MDKDTIEFMIYKEVTNAIKTIQKYCDKQLGCSLCLIKEWCVACANEQPLDWRI